METILLSNIVATLDVISSVAELKEMREVMKERYVMGAISKEKYKDFLEGEMTTIKKCTGGETNV